MYCLNCGNEIMEGAQFCTSCGAPATRVTEQAQPDASYAQQTQQDQPGASYAQQTQQAQSNDAYAQATSIYATYQTPYPRENNSGLLLAAFILNLISTIGFAILIIPLAWCIPMTVHSYGIYKGTKPNTVAFGVCTLIFVSLIGGILMLVADKDE